MQNAPTTSVAPTRPRNVGPTNPEAPIYKLTASPTPSVVEVSLSSAFLLPVQVAISCVLRHIPASLRPRAHLPRTTRATTTALRSRLNLVGPRHRFPCQRGY
jgi:hypothetical protein